LIFSGILRGIDGQKNSLAITDRIAIKGVFYHSKSQKEDASYGKTTIYGNGL
jgi:hypothetical protein